MPPTHTQQDHDVIARQAWMRVLARAGADDIRTCLRDAGIEPQWTRVRGPESGLAMVRGRVGGSGAPFNLGEMSVTRCTVCLANGTVGHAYVVGRDQAQAELAAVADALLLAPDTHESMQRAVIAPLAAPQARARETIARKAAATRVDFFALSTMRTTS
ncbi:MAG TPA: phosphonate C-P lyase system protein PhnG [Acidisphaera sp.]|nr:phosphonate C-P lyase system protein PhnG [Acidisphaera sp.]